ncbi:MULTISPECIES: NmrA family NAD(P)-binding protein [unclassified Microbacterium]|uniref:NmrA family NAD(P)-binding protein n=1 Tax=Microbacterium TaxID=33882 RepID=UPI003BA19CE0
MIIVTAATGKLGSAVVERLIDRVGAQEVGVAVRNPAAAAHLAERGVRVRRADYADRASLIDAFEGARRVLLVSARGNGPDTVELHRRAIDAARGAGVEHLVYTSHMASRADSLFSPMRDHHATEAALDESGLSYTSLRNGFYASTVPILLTGAMATGELRTPVDGPVSWTTHADLADAAAVALTTGLGTGATPPLTGGEALDMAAVADVASRATGKTIRHTVVSPEEFRSGLLDAGVHAFLAGMLVEMFAAAHAGEFAAVHPALAEALGRAPQTLQDELAG